MLNKCIRPPVKNIGNASILEILKLYYLFFIYSLFIMCVVGRKLLMSYNKVLCNCV